MKIGIASKAIRSYIFYWVQIYYMVYLFSGWRYKLVLTIQRIVCLQIKDL